MWKQSVEGPRDLLGKWLGSGLSPGYRSTGKILPMPKLNGSSAADKSSYNCIDYQIEKGKGDKVAIIFRVSPKMMLKLLIMKCFHWYQGLPIS